MRDSPTDKVIHTISRFKMIQKGDSVLISISGGPDSVFLAAILTQIKDLYDLKLYCFHLDHKTRNGQSSKDAAFVRDFCENKGLELFAVEMDVKEWCRKNRFSFQDGARRLRIDLLNETAIKNSIKKIATGHTADDNAETFLMHLLRGSGLRGLSGIRPVNGNFIRPLLETFHSDILDYLAENKIPYCSDKSNLENIYSRNKIRNILMPFINDNFSKNFVKNLSGTIDVIRQENAFIDAYAMECLKKISDMSAETITIPLVKLKVHPESVIKRIIISSIELVYGEFTDINRKNLSDITRLCFSGNERKELLLAGGMSVVKENENLYFYKTAVVNTQAASTVQDIKIKSGLKQELEIAGVKYLIETFTGGMDFLKDKKIKNSEAYIDFEKIQFPVRIDYWHKAGERFLPLGLKAFKKLQDYFTDMKVPYSKRPNVPLFYDREKIIWVSNYRIDERVKIDEQTKVILHIKIFDI